MSLIFKEAELFSPRFNFVVPYGTDRGTCVIRNTVPQLLTYHPCIRCMRMLDLTLSANKEKYDALQPTYPNFIMINRSLLFVLPAVYYFLDSIQRYVKCIHLS